MVTIAKIGEGKGTSVAIPNLLTHEGSVFSLEIGGDTYRNTFNYRKIVMGQNVRVIDPFGVTGVLSDGINLLAELKKVPPQYLEVHAARFCACIYGDESHEAVKSTGDNQIFTQTASQITLAHILYLCTSPAVEDSDVNIAHLKRLLLNFGTGHPELDLSSRFKEDSGPYANRYQTAAAHLIGGKHINDNKTTYGIGFTIRSAFAFADSQLISSVSNESTFDLDELKKGKNTLTTTKTGRLCRLYQQICIL
jgi:type IV secretory pathway TraG/TraD family ATPase VirD4